MLIIYSIICIIIFFLFFFFLLLNFFLSKFFLFFKNTSARKKVKIILLPIANILNTGHREHTRMEPGHTCLSSKNNRNNNNNINNCNAGPYSIGLWHAIWPLFNLYAKAVMSGTRFHHLQIYSYCNLSHIYTQTN